MYNHAIENSMMERAILFKAAVMMRHYLECPINSRVAIIRSIVSTSGMIVVFAADTL